MNISAQKFMLRELKKDWIKETWGKFEGSEEITIKTKYKEYNQKWVEYQEEHPFEKWLESLNIMETE